MQINIGQVITLGEELPDGVVEGEAEPLERAVKVRCGGIDEEEMAEPFGDQPPGANQRIAENEGSIVPDKAVELRGPINEKRRYDDQQESGNALEILQERNHAEARRRRQSRRTSGRGARLAGDRPGGRAGWCRAVGGEHRAQLGCDQREAATLRAIWQRMAPGRPSRFSALRANGTGLGPRRFWNRRARAS